MNEVKTIITTKCELLVSPCEDQILPTDPNKAYVEFVVGENIDSFDNCVLTYSHLEENGDGFNIVYDFPELYQYQLPRDQHYLYYRMWIGTDKIWTTPEMKADKFYYDTENDKLMLNGKEVTSSEELEYVANNPDKWGSTFGISDDVVVESVYSLCRISKCLENMQRKFIFGVYEDGIIEKCEDNANDKFIRDFLFSSVFILRQLVSQQRYEEADKILKKLNSCGIVCGEPARITKNDCGCK